MLPATRIKKKSKPLSYQRSSTGSSLASVIPRVASIQAWPKHKLNLRGEHIRGFSSAGDSSRLVDSHKIDYVNMRPSAEYIDKELANNRIKIMNMKTDFIRFKKLIAKIENRKESLKK
jgi:hypothetical protein